MDFDEKEKNAPVITLYEKKIGKTIYRVTNVYIGQFELGKALEKLIVKKIIRDGNNAAHCK